MTHPSCSHVHAHAQGRCGQVGSGRAYMLVWARQDAQARMPPPNTGLCGQWGCFALGQKVAAMRPLWKAHIAPSLCHEQMADCLRMKTYSLCGITLLIWLSCAGVALTWTQKPSSPSSRPEAGGIRLQQFFSRVQGQYTNAHAEHTHKTYATCSTALHHTAPHCTALHHTALHCTVPHCTTLHYTVPHCTTLHCTSLHCTSLHYTVPHCTTLHCTSLHCTCFAAAIQSLGSCFISDLASCGLRLPAAADPIITHCLMMLVQPSGVPWDNHCRESNKASTGALGTTRRLFVWYASSVLR